MKLSDDFLILVVTKLQKVGDAMVITSFNDYVERGILLPPHVVKVNPLHRDDKLGLFVEHYVIPILVKEGLEALIGAPFFGPVVACSLMKHDYVPWIHLVIVNHFSVGEDFWGSHL
jgi:hypothetical protein